MSRPDAKKNITTLVKAYGKNKVLREIANLVLVMGNREVSAPCWGRSAAGMQFVNVSAGPARVHDHSWLAATAYTAHSWHPAARHVHSPWAQLWV